MFGEYLRHHGLVASTAGSKVWNSYRMHLFLENINSLVTSVYFSYLDISRQVHAPSAAPLYLSEGAVLP